MKMDSNDTSSEQPEPDYAKYFKEFVARSVKATLDEIPADAPFLEQDVRARAMHVLSFALRMTEAWPATRDLILRIAFKMEQAGHRNDWMPYLEKGLACSQQLNDDPASAEIQWHIGHLYRIKGQLDRARQSLEASATTFAGLGKTEGKARSWNELGYIALHQQFLIEAQQYAKAALACLTNNSSERATSLSILGLVAIRLRHWQEGESYFKEALQIRRVHEDRQRMAWNMQHLGYVVHSRGDLAGAIAYYEDAIQILIEIQDLRNCGIAQMSLGIVYSLMNQPSKALAVYDLAESIFHKIQDSVFLAKILTNRGLDYLTLCNWQRAIETFSASADLYKKLGDLEGHINALDGLGLAYSGLNNYDEAIIVFESALSQLFLIKDDPNAEPLTEELALHLKQAMEKIV